MTGFALFFVGGLFCLYESTDFQFGPTIIVTILALLILEPLSARHKLYGMAPTTFPLYIFLALLPGSTEGLAMIAAIAAIGLRSATSKRSRGNWAAWEFLTDAVALCSAFAALKLLADVGPRWNQQPVVAVFAACALHFMVRPILHNAWTTEIPQDHRKTWESDQINATTLLSVVSFLGVPYGFLASDQVGLALVLPVAPFLLGTALTPLLDPTKDPAKIRLSQDLVAVEKTLKKTSKEAHSAETMLDLRKEDFSFLQQLAESLPHQPTVRNVLEEVLWLARRLTVSDNTVIFLERDDLLYAVESKSRYEDALQKAERERVEEPLVRRAFKTRRPDFLREEDNEWERIFTNDKYGVAVPIHDQGAIYLGRETDEPFSDDDLSRLSVLGHQTHLALRAARLSEAREVALANEEKARTQAESLLSGVAAIVNIMSDLIPVLDPGELLDKTGARLGQIVSHDYWVMFAGPPEQETPEYFLAGPPSKPKIDEGALRKIAAQVMERRVPVLEGDLQESSLPKPSKGTRSLLACPMYEEGGSLGALILCSATRDAFTKTDRDLLVALSYQLGSHFWNSFLHSRLEEALDSLKRSQAQLVQSSKMAAVGQLAAGVAHELNTPLGALMLAMEGAVKAMEKRPEKTAERIQKALKSAEQLKEIVAKLLFYSREGAVDSQETDLNRVIEDTMGLIGRQLKLDDIDFQLNLGEIDIVMANQNEMQQVVINLLTNAKDAVLARDGDAERKIVVTTSNHPRAVELAVEDTGIGMPEAVLNRVFEPFYTTKDVGHGTGLGLCVTKELVEKHGGAIKVQSTPGKGTKFMLRLPKVNN